MSRERRTLGSPGGKVLDLRLAYGPETKKPRERKPTGFLKFFQRAWSDSNARPSVP